MKYIGFIKEYNNISEAIPLEELVNSSSSSTASAQQVLKYLNRGILILGWMGYFIDFKTKQIIAPDSYYTDGIWVWPSYLPYYLNKFPSLQLGNEFLNYLIEKNYEFRIDEDFLNSKKIFEDELSIKLNG